MAHWKNGLQTSDEIVLVKRRAVIRESGRIFSRRGYHNTSLDDVAKALNVSKGTLYNYVQDKEDILFECHKLSLDIGERALEIGQRQGASGAEKLRLVLQTYVADLHDEFGGGGIITELDALSRDHRREIIVCRDTQETRLITLLDEGIADGSLRPVDRKLAIYTILGAINYIPRWYSPKGRLTNVEIAEGITEMLLHGLIAPS